MSETIIYAIIILAYLAYLTVLILIGFITGIIVGFILMVSASFFTPAFSQEHIDRIWG